MGVLRALRLTSQAPSVPSLSPGSRAGIVSPWTSSQLETLPWSDIFDVDLFPVTRAEAMSVPAVAAARSIIINKLASLPLRALRSADLLAEIDQPSWLYRTDTAVSPWHRMAQTLDDLLFYGDSLWVVERGSIGQIIDGARASRDQWQVLPNGTIQLLVGTAWMDAPSDSVVYIPGPFEGLLNIASRTIRGAVALEKAWTNQARTPIPGLIISERDDNGMTQSEAQEWVAAAAAARRSSDGSVIMFMPNALEATVTAGTDPALLIEARNAVKLDVANFTGIPASELEAALPKASLNYETQAGTAQIVEDRMSFWTGPIEARLSMDDVCPRGTRIRFDFAPYPTPTNTPSDTGPVVKD